jgi:hypothetical protein
LEIKMAEIISLALVYAITETSSEERIARKA